LVGLAARLGIRHPGRLMRSRVLAVVLACALAAGIVVAPGTALAADPQVKSGRCSLNGSWRLAVEQYDPGHLRVRFVVRNVAPGSEWQFLGTDSFGLDSSVWIFKLKKIANESGVARVIRIVVDQTGTDTIKAQAINYESGNTCGGGLSF
jgi:hypothetical protein